MSGGGGGSDHSGGGGDLCGLGGYSEPSWDDMPEGGLDPPWVFPVMVAGLVMLFFGPLLVDVLVQVLKLFAPVGDRRSGCTALAGLRAARLSGGRPVITVSFRASGGAACQPAGSRRRASRTRRTRPVELSEDAHELGGWRSASGRPDRLQAGPVFRWAAA